MKKGAQEGSGLSHKQWQAIIVHKAFPLSSTIAVTTLQASLMTSIFAGVLIQSFVH